MVQTQSNGRGERGGRNGNISILLEEYGLGYWKRNGVVSVSIPVRAFRVTILIVLKLIKAIGCQSKRSKVMSKRRTKQEF
jgi:hypothetical protein